ncbi:BglG family transcription antiterminator [Defluviitalea saccharophila]|uniref:BglG family transcription antiterminator n=1 Tax=Defluviitalea saccharophila TaxID=879970 RepID=A0ABZ2Y0M3_9FIRM|nr:BglG family transcription antiterminator [Candidatus Epulonipiscium sp.]
MQQYLSDRCKELVHLLLQHEEAITIKSLAQELHVSPRTIRNDLEKIEDYFRQAYQGEIILDKKAGVGVKLLGTKERKSFLERELQGIEEAIKPFSPESRKWFILRMLVRSNEELTMQFLADQLYVSKTTISKDLALVEEWLEKFNLKLIRRQNKGIQITGLEEDWRKAVIELLYIYEKDLQLKDRVWADSILPHESRLDLENYLKLKKMFPYVEVQKIESIIADAENLFDFFLPKEAYVGLLMHLAISIDRLRKKKGIKMDQEQLQAVTEQIEIAIARYIGEHIQMAFDVDMTESEIGFICLHILGAKLDKTVRIYQSKDVLDNIKPEIILLAKKIISFMEKVLNVDFHDDHTLLSGLVLHLKPSINRMKYGLPIKNPLLDQIKTRYPHIYGAVWGTSILFEKYFNVKVNEDEIGYIVIHLGAALQRLTRKIKAIIVCSSGMGTALHASAQIQKEIPEIEVVDITFPYDLIEKNFLDCDMIISTIHLQQASKPVIKINPLVGEEDIKKIKQYIRTRQKTDLSSNPEEKLENLIHQSHILTHLERTSKEQIIKALGQVLFQEGYVEQEFIPKVLEREKKICSVGVKNIVIVQGGYSFVVKPTISVATLKEPMDWSGKKVDTVFLLALNYQSEQYNEKFFRFLYRVLENEKLIEEIRQ